MYFFISTLIFAAAIYSLIIYLVSNVDKFQQVAFLLSQWEINLFQRNKDDVRVILTAAAVALGAIPIIREFIVVYLILLINN